MTEGSWDGIDVLVTGGAGFIGSNLSHELVDRGANVTILDRFLPEYGSNPTNLKDIRDDVTVTKEDIRDLDTVTDAVSDVDVVFHLAAQLSRTESNSNPSKDIGINCGGSMNILQAVSDCEIEPRVVFTSSQAVIGQPPALPITGTTRSRPIDVYGANKRAVEQYFDIFHRVKDVPTVVLRLTNAYGPRAQLKNPNYGVINRFIKLALADESLPVFKPGDMVRDFVYVGDIVEALLAVGLNENVGGEQYIVGSGTGTSIKDLADSIVAEAGMGEVELVPWPDKWKSIRVGDLVADTSRLQRDVGWQPDVELADGLQRTLAYYEEHLDEYV